MSLILIPGSSGSGKSYFMFRHILKEAQKHPEKRYLCLVPEQNTLQTQRTLVSMSERGGIWNIDVLSFTRLAYRVFEHTGVAQRQILSETGKVLLLRLITAREGARIPLLAGTADRPGVLSEIKSILSEMDQYGIGAKELGEMEALVKGAGNHPALVRKLSEIALVQEAFERYQADHFITGEKLPRVLSEKAVLDETLKGAVVCLDQFTGLTPAQLQVVTTLLGIVEDVLVTVTIDPEELPDSGPGDLQRIREMRPADHELFALSKRTIQSLVRCADLAHAKVEVRFLAADGAGRHEKGSELWWLEKHLLRSGKKGFMPYDLPKAGLLHGSHPGAAAPNAKNVPNAPNAQKMEGGRLAASGMSAAHQVYLRQCADPWDEAVSAAVTIEELIRKGIRYREIAIVCGSLKDYAEYIRRAMSVYEIPCYIDRSSTVIMNPAFEFARCAIDILEKNYSYESVMALLRTGLALDPESGDIDLLENYILAAGIRGHKMWAGAFSRMTRNRDEALRARAETAREAFMERFAPFAAQMKQGSALFSEYAGALWKLLMAFELPVKLDALSKKCAQEGREDRAQEYAAVLHVISGVLDEAAVLMGSEKVSRSQFAQILKAGFAEAKIGILPRGIDQVQVADLERSRLEQVRVVLFLGLNDGFVPHRKTSGGVLTDYEREILRGQRIHLAPTAREDANIQQFYLYLTLTRPSAALYLSWSMAKRSGEELRPSGVVRNLRAMFPGAKWAVAASADPFGSVTSLRTGRAVLAQALGDSLHQEEMPSDGSWEKLRELVQLYLRRDKEEVSEDAGRALSPVAGETDAAVSRDFAGRAETLAAWLTEGEAPKELDEETAQALYGEILRGSITRLEEFAACAFRHFADYGLKLKERETFTVRTLDIGNLLHRSVELFSRKLQDAPPGQGWREISDERRDALARECFQEALADEHGRELYTDTRRTEGILARCEKILVRSVRTLQRQIAAGAFEPAMFELSFGAMEDGSVWIDSLPGGRRMRLNGKIDRIDECEDEGTKRLYVKIVDYKSSAQDVDLERLIAGEQLQLFAYLDAAAALEQKAHPEKEIVCAGAFYFSFQDPVVDMTRQMDAEELEDAIVAKMRVQGLVNGRPDVVERLDTEQTGAGPSLVVPVTRNKTPGELRESDHVVTDRQFDLLQRYARDRMRKIAGAILSGQIAPNPSRKDANSEACTWCPYRDVCRFDPRARGAAYRELEKRTNKESWEIIEAAVSREEDSMETEEDSMETKEDSKETEESSVKTEDGYIAADERMEERSPDA